MVGGGADAPLSQIVKTDLEAKVSKRETATKCPVPRLEKSPDV